MAWYALENIEEALQDSKDLLLPFKPATWAKLAVIILFTGYVAAPTFTSVPFPGTNMEFDSGPDGDIPEYSSDISFEAASIQTNSQLGNFDLGLGTVGLAILAAIAGLVVLLTYITSVFEFVMYKSLIEKDVKLGHAMDYLSEGLQFFVFRWLTTLAIIIVVGAGVLAGIAADISFTITGVLTGLLIGGVTAVLVAPIVLLKWLVFNFSLLDMIKAENNLLKAFSRTLERVRADLKQVALFWAVKIALGIVLGFAVASVLVPALLLTAVPFAIIGFLLVKVMPLLVIPVILAYVVLALIMSLFVTVPVRVYVYYYVIEMYEDIF